LKSKVFHLFILKNKFIDIKLLEKIKISNTLSFLPSKCFNMGKAKKVFISPPCKQTNPTKERKNNEPMIDYYVK
jgi:hypothetical protein